MKKAKTKSKAAGKAKSGGKAKGGSKRKVNSAFMKPMTVSADLAVIVGNGPLPRSEVVKKLWVYIKKNNLQDSKNRRNINANGDLQKVFGGKRTVNMFEMTKLVSKHLS
ncbi:SWIB/MDM2 domain-containing protein [bacterium]|nr:SWIB/MDM2 domain-containing protein [bacterium]